MVVIAHGRDLDEVMLEWLGQRRAEIESLLA
jgi:hypothetical protein